MDKTTKKLIYSAIILVALDSAFMFFNKKRFETTIINVQRVIVVPKYVAFVVVYLLMISVLFWFILRNHRPIWEAVFLGLAINGIYEGTNYGIFKNWSQNLIVLDTLWGGVLFGLTATLVYQLTDN